MDYVSLNKTINTFVDSQLQYIKNKVVREDISEYIKKSISELLQSSRQMHKISDGTVWSTSTKLIKIFENIDDLCFNTSLDPDTIFILVAALHKYIEDEGKKCEEYEMLGNMVSILKKVEERISNVL